MARKTARLRKAVTKRATNKSNGSAVAASAAHLTIVESDKGRCLELRVRLDMNRERFARLVPTFTRNLANIESGKPASANLARQLQTLRRIVDALSEVIRTDAMGAWLEQPNSAFDGLKPIEVIERGEVDRIWQMIFCLRSGVPA